MASKFNSVCQLARSIIDLRTDHTRMNQEHPTVFVVDDDVSIRESLKNLFRSVGLNVKTYETAQEYLAAAHPNMSGCLVLDVRLPGKSGLELQHQLAESDVARPIIFITGHGDIPMSVRAMKAGAVEFLTKPFRDQDLLDAVQQAIGLDRAMRDGKAELEELRFLYDSLSPRERQVLGFVVQGFLNKQIAAEIGTSEATVKMHRGHMMEKMKVNSLVELLKIADRLGVSANPRTNSAKNR